MAIKLQFKELHSIYQQYGLLKANDSIEQEEQSERCLNSFTQQSSFDRIKKHIDSNPSSRENMIEYEEFDSSNQLKGQDPQIFNKIIVSITQENTKLKNIIIDQQKSSRFRCSQLQHMIEELKTTILSLQQKLEDKELLIRKIRIHVNSDEEQIIKDDKIDEKKKSFKIPNSRFTVQRQNSFRENNETNYDIKNKKIQSSNKFDKNKYLQDLHYNPNKRCLVQFRMSHDDNKIRWETNKSQSFSQKSEQKISHNESDRSNVYSTQTDSKKSSNINQKKKINDLKTEIQQYYIQQNYFLVNPAHKQTLDKIVSNKNTKSNSQRCDNVNNSRNDNIQSKHFDIDPSFKDNINKLKRVPQYNQNEQDDMHHSQ